MNSPVDIAEYRTRVEYQARVETGRDKLNQPVYSWLTLWSGLAAVRPMSQREIFYAGGTTAQVTHRVFLRYRPGVTELGRLKLSETRYLYLSSVLDLEERRQVLDCQAVEKTS